MVTQLSLFGKNQPILVAPVIKSANIRCLDCMAYRFMYIYRDEEVACCPVCGSGNFTEV